MLPDGGDEYDLQDVDQLEAMDNSADAFANVGQGLEGDNKTAMLQYWQQAIDDIERISDDGTDTDVFKSTVLPLARIKKVMKTDSEVRMISAEAPILFAKGCDIFITELTMRAWIHAEENKRRTLQRSDIATAIQKSDVFDFLIDIVPREESQPRRSSYRAPDHTSHQQHQHHQQPPQQPPHPSQVSSSDPSVGQLAHHQHGMVDSGIPGMHAGIPESLLRGMPDGTGPGSAQVDLGAYNPNMAGSMSSLGALSSIANLSNLNGLDLNALGNMPISYDNVQIPGPMGAAYPQDMQFVGGENPAASQNQHIDQDQQHQHHQHHQHQHEHQNQHQHQQGQQGQQGQQEQEQQQQEEQQLQHQHHQEQYQQHPQGQQEPHQQQQNELQEQLVQQANSQSETLQQHQYDPKTLDQQNQQRQRSEHRQDQSPSQSQSEQPQLSESHLDQSGMNATSIQEQDLSGDSSKHSEDYNSFQGLQFKTEEGEENEDSRYDSGELRFAPYSADSVDVSTFGQNF